MKYIIEIENEPFGRNDDPFFPHGMDELYRAKGFKSLVFDQDGLDKLTPYTEPDRQDIEDEVWATAIKIDIASEDWNWNEMTYREAKAEYERWKADREQIHIGDEVEYDYSCNDSVKFVVIGTNNGMAYGFKYPCETDDVGEYCELEDIRRTGRSFPEIVAVLKKMREES